MVKLSVQVPDVGENRRKNRNKCFLGWECKVPNVIRKVMNYTKYVFGSPPPCLLEWAEDVGVEWMEASCRLSA
jgi:hypothetical protein